LKPLIDGGTEGVFPLTCVRVSDLSTQGSRARLALFFLLSPRVMNAP
jgi:hypothetical protein